METKKFDSSGRCYIVRDGLIVIHRKEKIGALLRIKKSKLSHSLSSTSTEDNAADELPPSQSSLESQMASDVSLVAPNRTNSSKKHKKKTKKQRIAEKKDKKLRKKAVERTSEMFDLSNRKNNSGKLLANIFMNSYEVRVVNGHIYVYDRKRGIFIKKDKNGINTMLNLWIDKHSNENAKFNSRDNEEAYKMLLTTASIQREELSNSFNTPLVPFRNGVLNAETMELLPFSPEYDFTWTIKATYDESSTGELFLDYLDTVTQGDTDKQLLLQEIAGYVLSGFTYLRTAFIFIGGKGSGKSTILEVLASLSDEAGVCNIPFKKMENEYFIADILAAKLNIVPDTPGDVIKEISRFNSLVSDSDRVTGRSPYEKPETKRCRTKMLFGTNHHFKFNGPTKEDIEAFFDRALYVPFDKVIEKRIFGFGEILLKEESDFIASWAMQGLHRLIKNNFIFTKCKASERTKASAMAQYCPEETFYNQCIKIVDKEVYESSSEIRKAFKVYCAENKVSGNYNIKRYLDNRGIPHHRKRIDEEGKMTSVGNSIPVYEGIRLKNKYRV